GRGYVFNSTILVNGFFHFAANNQDLTFTNGPAGLTTINSAVLPFAWDVTGGIGPLRTFLHDSTPAPNSVPQWQIHVMARVPNADGVTLEDAAVDVPQTAFNAATATPGNIPGWTIGPKTCTWTNGAGPLDTNWSTAANWDQNAFPIKGDRVRFN